MPSLHHQQGRSARPSARVSVRRHWSLGILNLCAGTCALSIALATGGVPTAGAAAPSRESARTQVNSPAGAVAAAKSAARGTIDPNGPFDNAGLVKDAGGAWGRYSTMDPNGPYDNAGLIKGDAALLPAPTPEAQWDDDGGIAGTCPVPPNDDCASPTVISSAVLSYHPTPYCTTTANATTSEPQESCEVGNVGVSNTVWYSFTPCGTGTVTIDTFGTNYNTVLAMFTGTCANAAQVACSDDAIGTQARLLNVPVTAGTTYLIKVSDYNLTSGGGMLDFNFSYAPVAPSNDLCDHAVVIAGNATAFNPTPFCTASATTTPGELDESCGSDPTNGRSLWYSFTPCDNGFISVDTNGSSYDTVLSIFNGNCVSAVEVACDDDSGTLNNSQLINVPVGGGADYLIKVAAYDGANGGTLDFNFFYTATTVLPNDNCSSPTIIPGNVTSFAPTPYCTVAANATVSEPQESCEVGGVGVSNTVWYAFTPCGTGTISLDTNGSDYDTVLSVFTGTCAAAVQIACDDDSGTGFNSQLSNVPVTGGTHYMIKIADYGSPNAGGTLVFHMTYAAAAPANDLCTSATLIAASDGSFHPTPFCTAGATITANEPAGTCGIPPNSNSVWYRFVPCGNGTINLSTLGSNYDTVLSVFLGTCTGAGQVACNDNFGGGQQSALSEIAVNAGSQYLISIAQRGGTPAGGSLQFNFQYRAVCATGACAGDISPGPAGDGSVNVDDLLSVITHWGPCPAPCPPHCTADVAPLGGNCLVNVDDLLTVITGWGTCP